ncbi:disulfide oxidoreductase [Bacillus spizizenii]|uniref:disulfide oxidoreductase n=1 Tax=Bacillus spizizenii TaxID=96241 RepID=UPI003AF8A8FF
MPKISHLIAWTIALISVIGSLYFSEIKQFEPCNLCWYQRIFMYPIVILLGLSIIKKEPNIDKYVLSLSIPGFFLALYQVILQNTSILEPCKIGKSCSDTYINLFGFISIPMLSLISFFVITISLLNSNKVRSQ